MNKLVRFVVTPRRTAAALALMALSQAHAAIDVSSVTTGIGDAGVAILAVITALLAMSVSIFGLAKAYAFIKRKAGA